MRFLISGSSSSAFIYRSVAATVYVFNNDGSPLNLTTAPVVDLFDSETSTSPLFSLRVTPDVTLGAYGVGTMELPTAAGLASGSSYWARLRLDDGSGTSGKVVGATLSSAGAGFRTKPTVTVDGQGVGSGAVVDIVMTPAAVSQTEVTNGGSGYSSLAPPSVTVSGGSPATPAVFAAVVRGPITTTSVTTGGAYAGTPTVTASDGAGATLTPVMMTPIYSIAITNGGSGYPNGTWDISSHGIIGGTVTVSGGAVTAVNFAYAVPSSSTLDGVRLTWSNMTGGTGSVFTYTRLPIAALGYTTPSLTTASDTCINAFGSSVTLNRSLRVALDPSSVGQNVITDLTFSKVSGSLTVTATYTGTTAAVTNQDVIFTGGPFGSGAGVTVRFNGGSGSAGPTASIQSGGTNFTYPVIISVSGANTYSLRKTSVGFTINGSPNDFDGVSYTQFYVNNSKYEWINYGSGLTAVPATWLWQTTGNTATSVTTGMVVRYAAVDTVQVVAGGANYKTDSTLSFAGGSPNQAATGVVTAINGQVTSLTTAYAGTGYLQAPTLSFSSGTAAASAYLNTTIASCSVTTQGSNYTKQAQAVITGGSPTTAAKIDLTMGSGVVLFSYNRVEIEVE